MDNDDSQPLIVDQMETGRQSSSPRRMSQIAVTVCILLTEMGERLTYYSLTANIILYGTSALGFKDNDASTINLVFSGCVYMIPIAGGFIADSYTGRFKTIVTSACVYIVGIALVLLSAIDFTIFGDDDLKQSGKRAFFICGLALIAFGTGGIKANVGPFGAEQLESLGKRAVQSFFNWFYWVINIGALLAYGGVSYIQQNVSFAWGFLVPLIAMSLSLFIFVIIKNNYIRTEPQGSVLVTAYKICRQGCCMPAPKPIESLPEGSETKLLARAKRSFGGDHQDYLVDGLGSVIKVTPFCILLVFYWVVYSQMSNTFFIQGERLDVRLGGGVILPVAALNIFDTVAIILLIPVVDRVVYPFFEKIGKPLTYLKRMGFGMVLAAASLFFAGIVEIERKRLMNEDLGSHPQTLADKTYNASNLSIFVQIPQFFLIGASEIFTSITSLDFAYNQAPKRLQGLLTGLMLASSGLGSFLSTALLNFVQAVTSKHPWWGDEINNTKMEYLLFFIGGLAFVNFFVFCAVAQCYKYQDPSTFKEDDEDDNSQILSTERSRLNDRERKYYTQPSNSTQKEDGV